MSLQVTPGCLLNLWFGPSFYTVSFRWHPAVKSLFRIFLLDCLLRLLSLHVCAGDIRLSNLVRLSLKVWDYCHFMRVQVTSGCQTCHSDSSQTESCLHCSKVNIKHMHIFKLNFLNFHNKGNVWLAFQLNKNTRILQMFNRCNYVLATKLYILYKNVN